MRCIESELLQIGAVNARRRNDENALVIAWVCRSLAERVTSYRFALERLVIGLPSPDAAGG